MDSDAGSARRTIGKADKLRLKSDFDNVRNGGVKHVTPIALVVTVSSDKTRAGVICGRKFSLLSVVRNRARRLLWESFRLLKPEISPCDIVFIPRRKILKCSRQEVTSVVARTLAEAGLLPKSVADSPPER